MAELKHCGRCRKTTAFVDGACQRCAFLLKVKVRKPMTDEARERLKEVNERKKRERDARKRDAQTTNTEEK